jgi:uncharacterized protein
MKRTISIGLLALAVLGGCSDIRPIEARTEDRNILIMEMVGPDEKLLQAGKIDQARTFTAPDGVEIASWRMASEKTPARGTVVLLHGTGQSKANYLGVGRTLAKMGYDVVLIDLRCHGRSGGEYITCGAKEKRDVQRIVNAYAADGTIKASPLYVAGVTFGGATAIQYAAIEPKVAGVVALAPWKDTHSKVQRDLGLATSEEKVDRTMQAIAEAGGFDPTTTSAVNDVGKIHAPVYLIHGLADLIVPVADSEAIYAAANQPKQLKLVTPGPEQMAIGIGWETWLPEQIDKVATGQIGEKPPASEDDK